jgi:RNA polymerase sigma factor FliA
VPLNESQGQILDKYGAYVRSLAAQVRKQFNSQFEMDELVAWGQVGLLEASQRFDSKMGANFLTFAHYRIKGAIYDGLRKMGVLKGGAAASERANSFLTNLSDREMGNAGMGGSIDDHVRDISSAVSGLAAVFSASLEADGPSDEGLSVDERMEQEEMRLRVRSAIEKLPEKEKKLLEGYYFQGKTLEEAGALIGQSKSWASRLHARAVERLKQLLEEGDDNLDEPRRNNGGTTRRNFGSTGSSTEVARGPTGQQARAKQV